MDAGVRKRSGTLILSLLAVWPFLSPAIDAGNRYADPVAGVDINDGSQGAPWKTIAASIPKLQPGDTLYLRGGTYWERNIRVHQTHGAEGAPITIRNYEGETPIIDAGCQEYRAVGNADWEIHDAPLGIYRSKQSYPVGSAAYGYFDEGGELYRLATYAYYEDLSSNSEAFEAHGYFYIGPGVYLGKFGDGTSRIFIRLKKAYYHQGVMGYNLPTSDDPSQVPLSIWVAPAATHAFNVVESSHIVFEGLTLRHASRAFEVNPKITRTPTGGIIEVFPSHHLTFRSLKIYGGREIILIRDYCHDLTLKDLLVKDGIPPWIAWSDVKNRDYNTDPPTPAPNEPITNRLLSVAITIYSYSYNIEISNSTFLDTFDGIGLSSAHVHDVHIHHNTFRGIRDDSLLLGTLTYDVEINDNKFIDVSKGITRYGSWTPGADPAPMGRKWIHHNIVDCSRKMLSGRYDPNNYLGAHRRGIDGDGMIWEIAFGDHHMDAEHLGDYGDPWKLYNNTVLGGAILSTPIGLNFAYIYAPFSPAVPHEVYNNVFIQVWDHPLSRFARVADGSQILDGNIYHRSYTKPVTLCLLKDWKGAGTTVYDFHSLREFRASSIAPGWDGSSLEIDPLLDLDYRPYADSPAASGAVDLSIKGWPGAGSPYRGALAPSTELSKGQGRGWWKLDDGTGDLAHDASHNGNNGEIFGATWATGIIGGALSFDGADDYVDLGNDDGLRLTRDFTIALWMNTEASTAQALISKASQGGWFGLTVNGQPESLEFWYDSERNVTPLQAYPGLAPSTWYHLAVTVDRSLDALLYVNGHRVSSIHFGVESPADDGHWYLGKMGSDGLPFEGRLDDVRVFDRALSGSEIRDLAHGRRGWWRFDEDCGVRAGDSSFHHNPGAISGATWGLGKLGGALSFDGVDDHVLIAHDPSLDTAQAFSISLWVRPETLGTARLFTRQGPSDFVGLALDTHGKPVFRSGNGESLTISTAFSLSTWYHLAVTVEDGCIVRIYVDGVPKTSGGFTQGIAPSEEPWTVGMAGPGREAFCGRIDDIRFYGRALTDGEVESLARGPIAWWRFDEEDGEMASDSTTNGNDGVIFGATRGEGKTGNALAFDGIDDFVNAGNDPSINPTRMSREFTLCLWMYPEAITTKALLAKRSFGGWLGLLMTGGGTGGLGNLDFLFGTYVNDKGEVVNRYARTWSGIWPSTWTHVAVTLKGPDPLVVGASNAISLHVNGNKVLSTTLTPPGDCGANDGPWYIGKAWPAHYPFKGRLDDVRIYNRALTDGEIQGIFQAAGSDRNHPPIANAGADQVVAAGESCEASVTLDGWGSLDPDGDVIEMTWDGPFGSVHGPSPTVNLPKGSHTITLTVDDGHGGTDTDTVIVTVKDVTPPVLSGVPAVGVVEQANAEGTAVDLPLPTATDNCDPAPMVTSDAPPVFPLGITIVTFTATDASGNEATAATSVTVVDTTRPAFTYVPPPITVEQIGPSGTAVEVPSPTVTDICDAAPEVTDDAPPVFPPGSTTVTFTATDDSGNTAAATTVVTVIPYRELRGEVDKSFIHFGPVQPFALFSGQIRFTDGFLAVDFRQAAAKGNLKVTIGETQPVVIYENPAIVFSVQDAAAQDNREIWSFHQGPTEKATFRWKDSQEYDATRDPELPPNVGRLTTRFIHADETRFRCEWKEATLPLTVVIDGIVLFNIGANGAASSALPHWVHGKRIDVLYPGRMVPGTSVEWCRNGSVVYSHEASADGNTTDTYIDAGGCFVVEVPLAGGIAVHHPERTARLELKLGETGTTFVGAANFVVPDYTVVGKNWKYHEDEGEGN